MPSPVSDSYQGPPADGPYVPGHCYPKGPRMCPCGVGELCLHAAAFTRCGCTGLPFECHTSDEDMIGAGDPPARQKPG